MKGLRWLRWLVSAAWLLVALVLAVALLLAFMGAWVQADEAAGSGPPLSTFEVFDCTMDQNSYRRVGGRFDRFNARANTFRESWRNLHETEPGSERERAIRRVMETATGFADETHDELRTLIELKFPTSSRV